jgi:hypothetical protein
MINTVHKFHSYSLLAISQVAVSMGFAYYLLGQDQLGLAIGLICGNLVLVGALIFWLESDLQKKLNEPKTPLT